MILPVINNKISYPSDLVASFSISGVQNVTALTVDDLAHPGDEVIANSEWGVTRLITTTTFPPEGFMGIGGGSGGGSNKQAQFDAINAQPFLWEFMPESSFIKTARTWDCRNLSWADINPSDGFYDAVALGYLDAFVAGHKALGRKVIYNVCFPPEWAASSAGENIPGYPSLHTGSLRGVADQSKLANFITFIAQRYLALGTPIDAFELWNEINAGVSISSYARTGGIVTITTASGHGLNPALASNDKTVIADLPGYNGGYTVLTTPTPTTFTFSKAGADVVTTGTSVGRLASFCSATYLELALMLKTINQAAKAVTPTVKIISPPINVYATGASITALSAMLGTSDGAGGFMYTWADITAFHSYTPNSTVYKTIRAIKDSMLALATTLSIPYRPLINSETAYAYYGDGYDANLPKASFKTLFIREYIICLALDCTNLIWYQIGAKLGSAGPQGVSDHSYTNFFSLCRHADQIKFITDFTNLVDSYGITSAGIGRDGVINYVINGVTYRI